VVKEQQIYLIRHLPTSMNKSGAYMGREHNPPILEGEVSVLIRKLEFMKEELNLANPVFYSSPALRCLQTLEIITAHLGLSEAPVKTDNRLLETDFGDVSGLTIKEMEEQFPEVFETLVTDQSKTVFPNGESYQDVQNRAWVTLKEIIENSRDASSIFVCSHVDVIKMILFKALDIPIKNKPLVIFQNGSICTLVVSNLGLKLKLT
jgi:alpha-ribazole phosphatase